MNTFLIDFDAHKKPELFSIQFEQAVLAAMMTIDSMYDQLTADLTEIVFFAERHKFIYRAIKTLATAGKKYDAVLVHDWLTNNQLAKEAGGEEYLMQILAESPASLFNAPSYVEKLLDLFARRNAETVLNQALQSVRFDRDTSASDTIAKTSIDLIRATETENSQDYTDSSTAVTQMMELILGMHMHGTPTGFIGLDNHIGGLAAGQLIVIAARPSMGKSLFAANISTHLMDETGKPTLFFSLEMSAEDLTIRSVCALSNVPIRAMKSQDYSPEQFSKFQHSAEIWRKKPFLIDMRGYQTPESIRNKARKIHRERGGLACIVVDYIQLMKSPSKGGNRTNEIDDITRSLKELAKELQCPVIALSQLNRELEKRPNKRPQMSDLRESGSIEQDADVILFIYRDDFYNEASPARGFAEIIVGKQRQGSRGVKAMLTFNGALGRFENPIGAEFVQRQDQ